MADYIALIHKETESDFGVSFPDFPGCITAGVTLDEARAMAEEALAFHVEGLLEDGEAMPEPSSLTEVMAEPNNREGVAVLVTLKAEPKTVRVNITLPDDTLREIDRYASEHGFTRSGLLAAAARKAIREGLDA